MNRTVTAGVLVAGCTDIGGAHDSRHTESTKKDDAVASARPEPAHIVIARSHGVG